MHRNDLLNKLERHGPFDEAERESLDRMIAFVKQNADCFERSLQAGHITGAAWLLSRDASRVLLTHHRKLDLWLQLGGHADGDPDVLAVALREAREESGIDGIVPLSTDTFDVDVHAIPAHGNVPEHFHYDVRFLVQVTESETYRVSDESHDLAWLRPHELPDMKLDESVLRMCRKWLVRFPAAAKPSVNA